MERFSPRQEQKKNSKEFGTLAIDLGNSTTVVAFQGEKDRNSQLIDLPPISRAKGEIPSLVWACHEKNQNVFVGQEVLDLELTEQEKTHICSDFKRWIGADNQPQLGHSNLLPEKAGELLIHQLWKRLPSQLAIKRLVLTAPVSTYRAYRKWLNEVCHSLPVDEIALVDEPTAAAMGAGLAAGSKLLVVDVGGCTIDLSLVSLEGGEGRAEPVAQLLRFAGEDLEGKSTQIMRCAKVLGKAGLRLGGRDFDRWIANHLFPDVPLTDSLLNAAEKLKCRLSQEGLNRNEFLEETVNYPSKGHQLILRLNRSELEELLIERGLLKSLTRLLSQTLELGYTNDCSLKDLHGAVLVGGGARIPLIRNWIQKNSQPAPFLTPPPIEAVAKGALSLTPGVTIRDVLRKGASLRCWDKKSERHIWHPLFVAGQPWPTTTGLQLILSASKKNQNEIDLVIGEPEEKGVHEVIYINGVPTIKDELTEPEMTSWSQTINSFSLTPPGEPGEDCLQLNFIIDTESNLQVEGKDLRTGKELKRKNLGLIR
ncbi:Hsp70 family protein [Prochlorococcus sp. MIT 1307]|uniref:Hsp70 family protein n=1 Tax=Prochlorococcus sp. MIT 1307 TaxID=3096219 RepID=UPI002A74D6F3|nr:Hsp70 family protein [Prochlorococcus sp. MIT 1307]